MSSLCLDCTTCSCAWVKYGKPVDGWHAKTVERYGASYRVSECPEFVPTKEWVALEKKRKAKEGK